MLVLSRKKGESVVVNGNITIVVVDIRGDKARIGIEAPADVAVYRSEVLDKSAATNENGGATETKKTSHKSKKDGETVKRGRLGGARGAKKKSGVSRVADANAVETLYLSNENEAYRRADSAEEAAPSIERNASNGESETVEAVETEDCVK